MGSVKPAFGLLVTTLCLALVAGTRGAAILSDSGCLDCHGSALDITNAAGVKVSLFVDASVLAASVHATNQCISCHRDVTSAHPDDNVVLAAVDCARCHATQSASYGASVHGRPQKGASTEAATCVDCHGSHDILSPLSTASPLGFAQQPQTCGRCHATVAREVADSVHGRALAAGKREAPTCTDCHSEHKIQALEDDSVLQISEVCSRCHASLFLNDKYNLPPDRVKTYLASYHGLAAQNGSTAVADCASCHGYHRILPSSNPDSLINTNHLVATCGKCHPGASRMFVSGKIHEDAAAGQIDGHDPGGRINLWVRRIYLGLIFGVVGAMFLHNALLFHKKVAAHLRASGRKVVRMSLSQRWQHAVLALSFITLALTGFALRFPDSGLAAMFGSSEPCRRWIHRVAGLILLLTGVYHLFHLARTTEGRRLITDLFPVRKDLADLWCAVRYLSGISDQKPQIGRFGYAEKMEYWAVLWGTIIMGVTGVMIWFKLDVTRFLPRWAVEVATTIHYYEAVLACLAIVVWHFYHVIFDPDVYPLNRACWDGRVSEEWLAHEHPLDQTARFAADKGADAGAMNSPENTPETTSPEVTSTGEAI